MGSITSSKKTKNPPQTQPQTKKTPQRTKKTKNQPPPAKHPSKKYQNQKKKPKHNPPGQAKTPQRLACWGQKRGGRNSFRGEVDIWRQDIAHNNTLLGKKISGLKRYRNR